MVVWSGGACMKRLVIFKCAVSKSSYRRDGGGLATSCAIGEWHVHRFWFIIIRVTLLWGRHKCLVLCSNASWTKLWNNYSQFRVRDQITIEADCRTNTILCFLILVYTKLKTISKKCNWTQVVKFKAKYKLAYHKAKCMFCTANYYFDFKGSNISCEYLSGIATSYTI